MKTRTYRLLGAVVTTLFLAQFLPAQITAFTYQGRLIDTGQPANGAYDFQFRLYDAPTGGSQAPIIPVSPNVTVSNGLFTTAMDFGSNVFNGSVYWLEIAVQPHNGASFTTLAPRQEILPVPGAIFANSASNLLGTLAATQLNGTIATGSLPPLNAGNISSGTLPDARLSANVALRAGGNTFSNLQTFNSAINLNSPDGFEQSTLGNFVIDGTTPYLARFAVLTNGNVGIGNSAPQFKLDVNGDLNLGSPATIYSSTSPLLRMDLNGNFFAGTYAGNLTLPGLYNVGVGYAALYLDTVGSYNTAIGGAALNSNTNGNDNTAVGVYALVSNTSGNTNTAVGSHSLFSNTSGSLNIGLGYQAGYNITTGSNNIDIGNPGLSADANIIRIGSSQAQTFIAGTINGDGGGLTNLNGASLTSLNAGNVSSGTLADTRLSANVALRAGGNTFTGTQTFNGLVSVNSASGFEQSSIGNFLVDAPFLPGGRFSVLASGNVGVGTGNPVAPLHVYSANNPTIVRIQSTGTPGFGRIEFASNPQGDANEWRPAFIQSLDGGGFTGGLGFYLNGTGAANKTGTNEVMRLINGNVGIGTTNPTNALQVAGDAAFSGVLNFGGSDRQLINFSEPGIPLGMGFQRDGFTMFFRSAAGFAWYARGTFTNDDNGPDPGPGGFMSMVLDGNGNLNIAGSFGSLSDRNAKQGFESVDAQETLEKVLALPLSRWSYKTDPTVRHLGPMAQDFHAAFDIGVDDHHITTVDAEGVALAAIQGLNEKLETGSQKSESRIQKLEAENAALQEKNASLEKRLEALEKITLSRPNQKGEGL